MPGRCRYRCTIAGIVVWLQGQVSPVCADHLAGPEVGSSPRQQTQGAQVQVTGVAPTERCRAGEEGVRYRCADARTGVKVWEP